MVEVVKFVHKFGPRKALVKYIMEIGLLGQRIYLTVEMHALDGIRGMVAEGESAEDWTHSQCLGRVGVESAVQRPICRACRPWPVRSSLETRSIYVGQSCETSQAWQAGGGT